jgi:hypothetical protein
MKTYYQCEICGRDYNKMEDAKECEDRPKVVVPPIGVIFGNATTDTFYRGITFATADNMTREGHSLHEMLWACRDNHGDSIGKERCGSNFWNGFEGKDAPDPKHPTFKRLVLAIEDQGIKPQVWNGKKVVSLAEFLKEHKK